MTRNERTSLEFGSPTRVFDAMGEVIVAVDRDWRVRYVNPAVETISGLRIADVQNQSLWQAFPALLGGEFHRRYVESMDSGRELDFEAYYDRADRWLRVRTFPSADGLTVMLADHTSEHERVTRIAVGEAALRRQTDLLGRVIEGMRDGLVVRDATGHVMFANSITRQFLGQAVAGDGSDFSAEGVVFHDPLTGEVVPADALPSSKALRGQSVDDAEMLLTSPGRPKPLLVQVSAQPLLNETGEVDGCMTWFRDITDIREAELARSETEARLRQAQKMEAVGQLAGGIAHDFNNLLTVIVGSGEMLLEELATAEADVKRLAEQISAAANRGAELTQRLLAFSRRQPLKPTVVNVNALASGMLPLIRRALGEAIAIVELFDAQECTTLADASNLENALLNLAVNARDAMPAGGTLTIETRNILLADGRHDVPAGEYVILSVTDTGSGMSPEVQAKAFEPFFTTKDAGRGSGLGLATIYGFVRQSGGFVDIESKLGVGTTVVIGLPRVFVSGVSEAEVVQPPAKRGHGELILVVEDDEFVRATVVRLLGDMGYRALAASDAREGLSVLIDHEDIALVFTDVVMPGMSGWDLAAAVNEVRPQTPILFATGYTDNVLLQRPGLDSRILVLSKPFKANDLADALETLLHSHPEESRRKTLDVMP
ncbi:PAS domain-containing protein [Iodidimonas sp. SYSU 1G8]|uniref:hybrid sensor histidine kinase/response regulator n=1 Tax=Iodidimonas sp. SYSU 1G8 TaxID=3133967 RepID=UPI0031FF195D